MASSPAVAKAMSKSSPLRLVWHRRDLRLHDNILYDNLHAKPGSSTARVVSLYIFDDNDYLPRKATCSGRGLDWTAINIGPHAARNQLEAVHAFRKSLRSIGGELLVRKGCPATILAEMVQQLNPTEVVWNEEPGFYEARLTENIWEAIRDVDPMVSVRTDMQYTLYHPHDLPHGEDAWQSYLLPKNSKRKKNKNKEPDRNIHAISSTLSERVAKQGVNNRDDNLIDVSVKRWEGMPRIMGEFRNVAREATRPRSCLAAPFQLLKPESLPPAGEIPKLEGLFAPLLDASQSQTLLGMPSDTVRRTVDYAKQESLASNRACLGEQTALHHLKDFCENHAAAAVRNLACVDDNQSSRLSHFLAFGCVSPRRVVEEAENHGAHCNWLISHMTMRDFFLYTCMANGPQFYKLEGIPVSQKHSKKLVWKDTEDPDVQKQWRQWALGETGLPLVDAAMKELITTGYCSNRVRQNVASVLSKDLGIDWRAGAEWLQFQLEDHCVGANWGNWLYFSGVGPDPKQRHFRTVSQALKYDPDGTYVLRWLPKLAEIHGEEAYLRPWDYDKDAWREPIVSPQSQYLWKDYQRLSEMGSLLPETVEMLKTPT